MSVFVQYGLKKDGIFKLTREQETRPIVGSKGTGRLLTLIDVVKRYATLELQLFFDVIQVEPEINRIETKKKSMPRKSNYLHGMAEMIYEGEKAIPLEYVADRKVVIYESNAMDNSRFIVDLDDEHILVVLPKLIFTLSFSYLRGQERDDLVSILVGMENFYHNLTTEGSDLLSYRIESLSKNIEAMGKFDLPAKYRKALNLKYGQKILVPGGKRLIKKELPALILTFKKLQDKELWWYDTALIEKNLASVGNLPTRMKKTNQIQ